MVHEPHPQAWGHGTRTPPYDRIAGQSSVVPVGRTGPPACTIRAAPSRSGDGAGTPLASRDRRTLRRNPVPARTLRAPQARGQRRGGHRMITIPATQLRLDRRAWPRFGIDQDRVALFASLLGAGEQLPPIEVVPSGDGTFLVADGVHRTLAAKATNCAEIEVIILNVPGGESPTDTAYRRALETATTCALPLTSAERRQAAYRLLAEQPPLSHRAIARLVGVSHNSVDRWAKELEESSTPAADDESEVAWTPERVDQAARRVAGTLLQLDRGRRAPGHAHARPNGPPTSRRLPGPFGRRRVEAGPAGRPMEARPLSRCSKEELAEVAPRVPRVRGRSDYEQITPGTA